MDMKNLFSSHLWEDVFLLNVGYLPSYFLRRDYLLTSYFQKIAFLLD